MTEEELYNSIPQKAYEDTRGLVYKYPKIVKYMCRKIDEVSTVVTYTDKLQFYMEHQLNNYIDSGRKSKSYMYHLIDREVGRFVNGSYKKQDTVSVENLGYTDDSGDVFSYEIPDDLGDYDNYLIGEEKAKKMIAIFGKCDQERRILTELYHGKSEREIAECLATEQSIHYDSVRKNMRRFKTRNIKNAHLYIRIA